MEKYGNAYRLDEIAARDKYELIMGRRPTFAQIKRKVFMWLMVGLMLVTIFKYLDLQIEASNHREHIMDMQKSLYKISDDNADEYRRLSNIEDLDKIRDIAMNDLGMVYAESGQIQTFSYSESDYVRQTAPIK